jgi:hypothetical protein
MACKGICIRHKAPKPVGSGRYVTGQKRCQVCELFIKWDGLWCPCCGYRLRTRPRNLKYKAKLKSRQQMEEARKSSLSSSMGSMNTATATKRIIELSTKRTS